MWLIKMTLEMALKGSDSYTITINSCKTILNDEEKFIKQTEKKRRKIKHKMKTKT